MEEIKIILIESGIHISDIGLIETDSPNLFEIRYYATIDIRTKTDNILMDLMKIKGVKSVHLE